jgi:hypothetical protein
MASYAALFVAYKAVGRDDTALLERLTVLSKLDEVAAADLILSTTNADGKTATYDEEASVPTVHQTKKEALIVTSASACLALSCAPAADFRRSCGPTHRPG